MNVSIEQASRSHFPSDSERGETHHEPEQLRFTLGGQMYAVFVRQERDSGSIQPSGTTDALLHFLDEAAEGGPAPNTWRAAASALNRVHDPLQDALASRLLQSCSVLIDRLRDEDRAAVLAASGDLETLLRALEAPAVQEALAEQDPLGPARVRWLEDQQRILAAEGGTLTTSELAKALGITKEGVRQRAKRGSLLSLPVGNVLYFPLWQFINIQEYKPLIGLRDVLHVLPDQDAWGKAIFLLGGEPSLDGARPLDCLRRGELASVLAAARQYGEQGAR